MVKKMATAIAAALFIASLSATATAATEQEARAELERVSGVAADAQRTAQTVLSELVAAGVTVDQALEVVRSALERQYSAGDLRQMDAEIREQVQAGIPSADVTAVADRAIDAGRPAAETLNALNTFQQGVERGKRADTARARGMTESAATGGAGGLTFSSSGSGSGSGSSSSSGGGGGGGGGGGDGGSGGGGGGGGGGSGGGGGGGGR